MFEPTNTKTSVDDPQSFITPSNSCNKLNGSRPIDISSLVQSQPTSLTHQQPQLNPNNEVNPASENPNSAYASAESSPTQTNSLLSASSSCHSLLKPSTSTAQMLDLAADPAVLRASPSSASLASLNNDNSRLIQDIAAAIKDSATPSTSQNDLTSKSEYSRLPQSNSVSAKLGESTSALLNDLQFQSLPPEVHTQPKTEPSPTTSPKSKQSSVFSMIEKMLYRTSSNDSVKQTAPVTTAPPAETKRPETIAERSVGLSTSAASASSPNPDCSPYKLLMTELKATKIEPTVIKPSEISASSSSNHLDTANSKLATVQSIESLTSLNHKEYEKVDPILSGASTTDSTIKPNQQQPSQTFTSTIVTQNPQNQQPVLSSSTTSSGSSSPTSNQTSSTSVNSSTTSSSSIQDHVPSSSREFCMNLNFNLAAAAAATAAGPVVVVDNLVKSPSQVSSEHNRFTSNASTSSIHNDLKMILEESKDKKTNVDTDETQKALTQQQPVKQEPKPQRQNNRSPNKHNKSNDQLNKSNEQPKQEANKQETIELSPSTKSSPSNLIKLMMGMTKLNSTDSSQPSQIDWSQQTQQQNGHYRYSKDFLLEIREHRSKFIENINPDLFKAYCYCMNGKYWDPEKYFDIGEYERAVATRQRQQNYYNKNNGHNTFKKTGFTNTGYRKNNRSNTSTPNTMPGSLNDSPQPLQVPKNSPKVNYEENRNHDGKENMNADKIFSILGVKQQKQDADKVLLNLIQKEKMEQKNIFDCLLPKNENQKVGTDLLGMVNKKPLNKQSENILDSLFPSKDSRPLQNKTASNNVPKHSPLILTAQELEQNQFKKHKKLPVSQAELCHKLEELNDSNNSVAYRQLVQNLNNHPLSSPLNQAKPSSIDNLLANLQQNAKQQSDNEATKALKQLLNLSVKSDDNSEKKPKNKRHHHHNHHHHHNKNKQTTPNQFPSVNPHEKPFEPLNADENRNNAERVVANALSQVLNRSPSNNQATTSKNLIESLIEKMNQPQLSPSNPTEAKNLEQTHFNSLLNKMNQPQPQQPDILKWFPQSQKQSTNFSATSLSEIELMQVQRPAPRLF